MAILHDLCPLQHRKGRSVLTFSDVLRHREGRVQVEWLGDGHVVVALVMVGGVVHALEAVVHICYPYLNSELIISVDFKNLIN